MLRFKLDSTTLMIISFGKVYLPITSKLSLLIRKFVGGHSVNFLPYPTLSHAG